MCTKNVGFEFEIWLEEIFHVQPRPFLRDVYNESCIPPLFCTMEFIFEIYTYMSFLFFQFEIIVRDYGKLDREKCLLMPNISLKI